MMRPEFGEMVRMASKGTGGLPLEFNWRGKRHRIRTIDRYHTIVRRGWNCVEQHRYFYLRTTRGMRCLLIQDVSRGIWRMQPVLKQRGGSI